MKKIAITVVLLLFTISIYSQERRKLISRSETRTLVSIKTYERITGFKVSDSLLQKSIIRNGDTLVQIHNDYYMKNRISVPYEPKDSTFLEIYKDVAYRKYQTRDTTKSKKIRLKYWKNEIKIYFTKSLDKKVKKELKSFANYLAKEVDSLKISFVNNIEKSNYIIYGFDSINNYKYDKRIRSDLNDYYLSWNGNQWFYDCKLQINKYSYKNNEDLILKSKKLFLKTLGHFNYTRKLPRDSYLSILYSNDKKFTNDDLKILKYHYSYGICKGTDLKLFEEQHQRAQEIYKNTGKHLRFVHKY